MRWALVLTLLLLPGCEDAGIYSPPGPMTAKATFTADPVPAGPRVSLHHASMGRNQLTFRLDAAWGGVHPTSVDLFFRVDPGASAEIRAEDGAWCGSQADVVPTARPGEWRIQRSARPDDCTCPNPDGAFALTRLNVTFPEPGTWRVNVVPASATPACDCAGGCPGDLKFYGGTANIPS